MTNERSHIRAIGNENEAPAGPIIDHVAGDEAFASEKVFADETADDDWYVEEQPTRRVGWIVPALAVLLVGIWSGFFVWANGAQMLAGASPQQWIGWISSWAAPVLLVVALWLLAMRNSAREAARFGDVANTLADESARLEQRLVAVNRELSLAREFLGTQSRELDFLGRTATERLSEHAGRLQALVQDNGAQVEAISTVSTNALENMTRLRDNLPVIANSTRDVTNQIGAAGRTAQAQLAELVAGFERLNDFGAASERQVGSLRKRVDEALDAFGKQSDQFATVAEQRFAMLREEGDAFRGELDTREVEALAGIRGRADAMRLELAESHEGTREQHEGAMAVLSERLHALHAQAAGVSSTMREGEDSALAAWGRQIEAMDARMREAIGTIQAIDERALHSAQGKLEALLHEAEAIDNRLSERDRLFHEEVANRRDQFQSAEDTALARLHDRLSALDAAVAERREDQLAQMAMLAEQGEALGARIGDLGTQFAAVAGQGDDARATLAEGIDALNAKLIEGREALDGTDMAVAALTDASVRLLELIQASARHSRDDLPAAMESSESRLNLIEQRAAEVRDLLGQARDAGEAVVASMDAADTRSRAAIVEIDSFQARFGETAKTQEHDVERLRTGVAALASENEALAAKVQEELRAAIAALETSAREALSGIETDQAERIERIAGQVGEKSAAAIDRAVTEHSAEAIAKLDEATQQSSDSAREAARQLRDQLAKVNELTGNLEARVNRARERAEEQVDNDFSRRVALITESLNSNAIDISKALSTEVTDTAWASYLRGDRGIFTRRAVRLLDTSDAREIAALYDAHHDFRDHVNRYIHDFEAMLRVMLSTRDGNAVSVTLLSSDMGKLYVALAQAIERLRN